MYKVLGNDQKIYGPVSVGQIRQWQAEGRVNSATLLQAEGSGEWRALSSTPEFGVPPIIMMPPAASAKPGNNHMAVAGLIFGALSNICCCFGIVCAVLGIVFSVIAINQHESRPQQDGKGMAVAGLILSVVGLTWHCFLPSIFGGLPQYNWFRLHHHLRRW
jgi:hypothetical protein